MFTTIVNLETLPKNNLQNMSLRGKEKTMDRDDIILVKILSAAKDGTLSKRKWSKYNCKSEDEMQTFLDALLGLV